MLLQPGDDDQLVHRLCGLLQLYHRDKNALVRLEVEVILIEPRADLPKDARLQQDGAEHSALRIDVLRQLNPECRLYGRLLIAPLPGVPVAIRHVLSLYSRGELPPLPVHH